MIDGVGNVSSVLVVGADNQLCLATVDRLVGPRLAEVYLLDSSSLSLSRGSKRVREFGIPNVSDIAYRTGDGASLREIIAELFAKSDIDVVLIGPMPHPPSSVMDTPSSTQMSDSLRRGLMDTSLLAELCAQAITAQGHGVLCLLTHSPSKKAGKRTDQDREYCASMAAFNLLAPAIAEQAAGSDCRVVCVAIDPAKDPHAFTTESARRSTLSPLDAASEIAPVIVSRRKRKPYEVVALPSSIRGAAGKLRPTR